MEDFCIVFICRDQIEIVTKATWHILDFHAPELTDTPYPFIPTEQYQVLSTYFLVSHVDTFGDIAATSQLATVQKIDSTTSDQPSFGRS